MTHRDDVRLRGRAPEFARMSTRPGLGAFAMAVFAEAVLSDAGLDEIEKTGDVPMNFRMGGKKWPLGRYLRSKLREEVGVPEWMRQRIIWNFTMEKSLEVSALLQDALRNEKGPQTASEVVAAECAQQVATAEAREKIYSSVRNTL